MNKIVCDFIEFIKANNSINTKQNMIKVVKDSFALTKDGRALYHNNYFAVVFCYAKYKTFPNVVLSLSKLQKYDTIPCFVVVVHRNSDNEILMINSTFIDKISHSSQDLRMDNIRGSFLGSNIIRKCQDIGLENTPDCFDDMFAYHCGVSWLENLERLVCNTADIKPIAERVELTQQEKINLDDSPRRASDFVKSAEYNELLTELRKRCELAKDALLVASHINNVNIRGRLIEVLITADSDQRTKLLKEICEIEKQLPVYDSKNDLADYTKSFKNADTYTDVKTKIMYLKSNPKGYNVDKFIKCMGEDRSVFMFFFVALDETGITNTLLCSAYDQSIIKSTLIQKHWSGRARRGTTQLKSSEINNILNQRDFVNDIDIELARGFIKQLHDL